MITLIYYASDWSKPKLKITTPSSFVVNAQGNLSDLQNIAYENNANLGFHSNTRSINDSNCMTYKDKQDQLFGSYNITNFYKDEDSIMFEWTT